MGHHSHLGPNGILLLGVFFTLQGINGRLRDVLIQRFARICLYNDRAIRLLASLFSTVCTVAIGFSPRVG